MTSFFCFSFFCLHWLWKSSKDLKRTRKCLFFRCPVKSFLVYLCQILADQRAWIPQSHNKVIIYLLHAFFTTLVEDTMRRKHVLWTGIWTVRKPELWRYKGCFITLNVSTILRKLRFWLSAVMWREFCFAYRQPTKQISIQLRKK